MGKNLIRKKVSFGFLVGSLGIIIDGLVGLAILPLLLKSLSKEIVGLWVFFVSFSSLIMLGQAGLAPVVMRLSAEIKARNFDDDNFWSLVTNSYRFVLLFVLLICLILYFTYIMDVLKEANYFIKGTLCWIFLTIGYMSRLYGIKHFHVINGLGEVGWDKIAQIVTSLTNLLGYFIVLSLNFELQGLGLVYLLSSLMYILYSKIAFNKFASKLNRKIIWHKIFELKELFKESGKILVLNLSAFVVMQSNVFIIERLIGLKVLPYYNGLSRIGTIIIAVSGLMSQMIYPFIAHEWANKNYSKARSLYFKSVVAAVSISFFASTLAFITAPTLVPIWLGKDGYLGSKIFGLILIFTIVYVHHVAHGNAVIATGKNTFVIPAIINAILAVPLSILGGIYYSIEGIILGNIIATIIPSIYVVQWSVRFFNESIIR